MGWTQEGINLTIWSLGCDWLHCQGENSDPTASPDDDSCMVSTPRGKDGKTKPRLPPPRIPPPKDLVQKNGSVQETPTHCFASFISGCVNSLLGYACATVFVLLHPDRPQCSDVLTDCFKIPSRQFSGFKVKQLLGQH